MAAARGMRWGRIRKEGKKFLKRGDRGNHLLVA